MDIFVLLDFFGGLALFLYGMKEMGDGLESAAGDRLEGIISRFCSKPWKGVLVGAIATAAVQSSSAITVMVIGFVNSGIMKLSDAVGVIMGANLGTTITSWILSLTGIEGDNLLVRLLMPSSLAPVLVLVGVIIIMRKKHRDHRSLGVIFAGLGILFFGMEIMSSAVEPIADNPEFASVLTLFESPIAGLLAGVVLTAIVQSSSASVGILQALAIGGRVSYGLAIPIVMGQNIGTCVTALLSSIGTSKNAKRAAFVHLYFNVIGTAVLLTAFYALKRLLELDLHSTPATAASIALIHTAFNLISTLILLPFASLLRRLAELTVKD